MFKTIRVQLTLWYVALLALILVAFSAALYFTLARSLNQQVDSNLRVNAEQLVGAANIEQGQISFQNGESDTSDAANVRARGYLVRLVDANGLVLDTNARFADLSVDARALEAARRGQSSLDTVTFNGQSLRMYTAPIAENAQFYGALQVAQPLDEVENTLRALLLLLAAIVPLTVAFALVLGYWFARRALAPIDQMTRAAQRISAEDLSRRLNLNLPDDEVGRLARTFDGMLARLDAAFRREREFTANASHEVRTPLTLMRGEIDVTLQRKRSIAEYERVLRDLGNEVDRLTELANDLLLLARADAKRLPVQCEKLNAARLVQGVTDEMQTIANAKAIALVTKVDESLVVWADEDKLLHVLLNLLDNAIKFTPKGGQVTLSVFQDGSNAVFTVSDTGVGITAEHLPHIFERFYRVDESRSSRTGGAGLGLAIAQSLVAAQGGTINVESAVGQGTRFSVRLPLSKTE